MNSRFDILYARNAYEENEDSDYEGADSSDEDADGLLNGALQRIQKRQRSGAASSSEDEFEKEMTSELDETMKNIEQNRPVSAKDGSSNAETQQPSFYDNSYFDSDSDEDGTSEQKKAQKHPILTNDELFYDPKMDDHDQKWIDAQRRSYLPKPTTSTAAHSDVSGSTGKPKPLPQSDAVLNCPGCMSLLCLDCQRHSVYSHQYRAMFVTNCTPDMTEVLRYAAPHQPKLKKSKKRKHQELTDNFTSPGNDLEKTAAVEETYHPVKCDLCKTEVAVYDKDEVFHFFNVLASY